LRDGGEPERARIVLISAAELAPERDDLAALLERWEVEAELEEDFWSLDRELVRLSYDGDRRDVDLASADRLVVHLERTYEEYRDLFRVDPVRDRGRPPVRVVLYRRDGFRELTGLGDWAAGVFDGRVRIPVDDLALQSSEVRRVLRHELAHWFVREVGGIAVPGWLNEGLCQWLEDRGASVSRSRARLAGARPFSLAELRGSLASWDDEDAIARAYDQSLVVVHHLFTSQDVELPFEMVRECATGRTPEEVFRARMGFELDLLVGDLFPSAGYGR
jgi:hypothetical protein